MRKSFNQRIRYLTTFIPLFAGAVVITAVSCVALYLKKPGLKASRNEIAISKDVIKTHKETKEDVPDYISETNYTGHLSQYPELYQIPFRKSDAYICNKDFSNQHYEIFEECERDATSFLESLFNVNYRDIAADQTSFVSGVVCNGDPESVIIRDYGTENERCLYLYDYIKELSDYFVQNQVEMDAKFYTDDSLVYSDFYIFVRGELVFTIYSSSDTECEYETGKEYQIPVEVAMQRTPSNPENRSVCSFGKAEDTTFFITP